MDGSEIKIFPLVRATTRGRPYGVQNTHKKASESIKNSGTKCRRAPTKGKKGFPSKLCFDGIKENPTEK